MKVKQKNMACVDPFESEEALDGEPGFQVPNDFDSDEEHDIEFESDLEQVVNMDGFAVEES